MKILIDSDYFPEKNKSFHKFLSKIIKTMILVIVIKENQKNNKIHRDKSETVIKNLCNYGSNDASIQQRTEKTYTGKTSFA
jgi:hypothetical protein